VTVPVERVGGLGVGVGVEEPVEGSQGLGLGLAGLVAGEGNGHDQAGGLPAAEADVEVDRVGLDDGDVLDEEPGDALAFPGRGGGIGPQPGEI
jgi:hypothetical protein